MSGWWNPYAVTCGKAALAYQCRSAEQSSNGRSPTAEAADPPGCIVDGAMAGVNTRPAPHASAVIPVNIHPHRVPRRILFTTLSTWM
jgi:hypothetical protein